ncbi:hypothetical protein SAMN06264364_10495 [Quadrisphaera granulorum]|uniref:Uncharacterized protein n=1 Tax=Quadrisphaera granulorum TaxID=317664 RepID=A0A316ABU6_9ACTN|nr:hypothetical protein [Quadrisphaera granulorum]PWJ55173.1 hypothetical protein BXY45_10495 [Quadrisphaera granulorum]SZE95682.1 hypothetical protein SAMN06264364_10495 [Quadrisphaera granulorum]
MADTGGSAGSGVSGGSGGRRPGQRGRRVVAPPTGAPGEELEAPELPEDAGRWAAEAERLRSERPPHWS